jgi:3-oxoacyl-[acyl-carrier protein] reductase
MEDLTGRVALVTGGSRGIGAAVARRLARDGADVAITYRAAGERAAEVVGAIEALGRRGLALHADSADPAAVRAAVDRTAAELGRLDILVNNAGVFPYGPFEEVGLDELDHTLAVHVRAAFVAAQAASAHLRPGGRIIGIGSNLAERVTEPGIVLYATSKAALAGLTRGLARELGPRGITVNNVAPGPIATEMNREDGEFADWARPMTSLGRYGQTSDIASVVSYLAGSEASFVTGANWNVDGGFTV